MPLVVLILLILFPSMEVYLLFSWIGESPFLAILYLIVSVLLGLAFLRVAKDGFRELKAHLQSRGGERFGAADLRMALALGKLWLIGALLLFPGYLTDVLALLMLLFVRRVAGTGAAGGGRGAADGGDGVVEARGRIIDDD